MVILSRVHTGVMGCKQVLEGHLLESGVSLSHLKAGSSKRVDRRALGDSLRFSDL